jgi:outer membrane lipoprotein carrier protein
MKHLRTMNGIPAFSYLAILLTSVLTSQAQDAHALLESMSRQARTYNSVKATYTSTLIDLANDMEMAQEGVIEIEGEKYNLDLGDYVVISDGSTVWTYETSVNECYIDDAAELAEDGMDPSKLFTIWEDDFKPEWKGEHSLAGRTVTLIHLYPNSLDNRSYHTIQLYIDEERLELVRAVVKGREGTDVLYDVHTFQPNASIAPGQFTFKAANYPGVDLIDNRL